MALDGIYLSLLKNEIAEKLIGFRVDKIYQPSRDEVVLCFRTYEGSVKLLLCAKADCARIQITNQHIENPSKPSMLTMLLRKHLSSAKLVDIEQDGFERILNLVFDARNDLGDPVELRLIIEIMGRHSNIVLVNRDNRIIECVKRVDASKSSVREVLPGIRYVLPPQQHKLNIIKDDISDIEKAVSSLDMKKSKAVSQTVQGISPIVAREVENGLLLEELRLFIKHPHPTVVFTDCPKDFTFFMPKQYGDLCKYIQFDSPSELLDYFYREQVRLSRIKQRSGDLFHHLTTLRERAVRKSLARRQELEDCKDKDKLRQYADIINANLYRLEKGSLYYDLENFYADNEIVRIPADPMLTPSQNAQKYYKEYRKKQIAQTKLYDFIKQADDEAEYIESVIDLLSRAESEDEINQIRNELALAGIISNKSAKSKRQKKLPPKQFVTDEGFALLVGRNNVQNDELTLKTAKKKDLWFHVKDAAGTHVIAVFRSDKPFTDRLIRQAAMLAALNSKAHASSNIAVDYTVVKNVHKPNGAKPGMVIYDDYNTEYVTPNDEELSEIKRIDK